MKRILFAALLLLQVSAYGQKLFRYAQVSDTHVGGATGADDLRATVQDLNRQNDIDFVLFTGDITEFGALSELRLARQILDSLTLPWYIVPGNHDSNWSESGANDFRRVFGGETFFFKHKGFQFMGTVSGPNMRMSPGQIPRENLVWMDSVFAANLNDPLIFINHYPLDNGLNNWYEAIDRIKKRNVLFAMCGHGHANKRYDWDGITGVMGRSNLRAKEEMGAYNLIDIYSDKAVYQLRYPNGKVDAPWLSFPFEKPKEGVYERPDYSVSAGGKRVWEFQDDSDLGAGFAGYKKYIITGNTQGKVYALHLKTGKKVWEMQTGGKVYSTPAVEGKVAVVGSSDHFIYGLEAATGKVLWKVETNKAVLGSPIIQDGLAYIGSSDGVFRAIEVKTGLIKWTFNQVKGYVSSRPLIYQNKVIFGSWSNGFYALDTKTGSLVWEWKNGHANRMFSAGACYPVGAEGKVFLVAPDRFMTVLDAKDGRVVWREKRDSVRVRESMGIAEDGKYVYVKTMDGQVYGVSTTAAGMELAWKSALQLPYELTPSAIAAAHGQVYVPSHAGLLSTVHAKTGEVLWQYKLSNAMINPIYTFKKGLVVSSMDGKIVRLKR